MVATPLGILQLVLYFKYKNTKEEPTTIPMSNCNDEKNQSTLELVVDVDDDGDINEKNSNKTC